MKGRLIGGAAVAAALSASALAADMGPVFKTLPPPPAPTASNWTGFYGGFNAGYSWGRVPSDYSAFGLPGTDGTLSPSSPIGGLQLGYNYQSGPFVFGVETDFAWRHGTDSALLFAPNSLDTVNVHTEQGWIGTLRPRAGVAINSWLFYATGGLAYGSVKHDYTETRPSDPGATRTASESNTRTGWTVGGGVEYAPGARWSLGLEYLYVDLGKTTVNQSPQVLGGAGFPPSSTTFHDQSHLLRGKLNYRFDWGVPKN
jgi:outer membrane immunogenic protein